MFDLAKPWSSILRFVCSLALALSVLFTSTSRSVQGQQGRNQTVLQVNQVQGTQAVQAFVEDEFIVVLKRGIRAGFRAAQGPSNRPAVNAATLQLLVDRHGVGRFRRQFAAARPRPLGSALPDLTGHFKVQVPKGVSLDAVMADFANDPNVEHVEKIGIHPVFITPNDTFYPDQWHHHAPAGIDSNLAWERNSGSPSVVVAVLDTGVHYNHPDLRANVWINPGEIPNNGIDDDHNGYIDDTTGYDFVESTDAEGAPFSCCDADCGTADNDPSDSNGHGTHVAGIVAAVTNNGIGVSGIAGGFGGGTPQSTGNGVRIMPLRVGWNGAYFGLLCGYGLIRMDYAAEALHYVALQKAAGVNVAAVNCSWGSSDSGGFGAAVDEVLASDVMVIHAAGNSSNSTADFLGSKAGVISVAATDQNGAGADFTNFGDYVEISAPGMDILSLWLGPDPNTSYYATASGTSMAAPHVSAVAGLLESLNPALTGPQKAALMLANTKPYVDDGRDLGSGILNANLALAAAGPATPDFLMSASPGKRIVPVGGSTTYDVTVTALSGFNGTIDFSATGLPFGAVASFSPGSVVGSGTTTMTVSTGLTTPGGGFPLSITGTSSSLNHSASVTLVVAVPVPAGVGFVKADTATQGSWKGVYGAEGFAIANNSTSYPSYAQVSFSNQLSATWAASTSDVRALQKGAPTATDRIASTWVSETSFDIDIDLSDGNWHQAGFYCLDWDYNGRVERIDILDAATSNVLDTRTVTGFSSGQYLLWNLRGHTRLRVTRTGGANAVISGIFFDAPAQPDFSLSATPVSQTVAPGSATSYQVTVVPSSGFAATVSFNTSGLPAGASASFSPTTVTGSGTTTMTVSTGLATLGGSFPLSITGTSSSLNHSANVTLAVAIPIPVGVGFIKTDAATQGSWKGVYGADGFAITNDTTSYPGYAQVSFSNQLSATWAASTSDVRALQKGAPTATDRIASTWVSNTSFDIDIDLSDGNWHQVGFYCLDWDTNSRAQRIDILDAATSNVLDTRTVTGFSNGQYLLWNLRGHTRLRVTRTGGANAVISGIFFDAPAQPDFSLSAAPVSQTVAPGNATTYQVTVAPSAGFGATVSFNTSGLPAGASASFSPTTVTGSGTTTMTVSTGLTTPQGNFPLSITGTSSTLSHSAGITLVVVVPPPIGVAFIKTDTVTQGSWKGVYGAEGFAIANNSTSYPSYAQVSFSNQLSATWAASTSDVRALQKGAPTATDRIASTWVSNTSFDIDIDLSDGNWHQVGFYCLDWDTNSRAERIDILDAATSNVLDTRTVTGFSNGQYLLWNLRGHNRLQVTRTGGANAVISGIFFDAPAQPDFSLSAAPVSQTVAPGNATTYQVTVAPSAGFGATVSFNTSGLPAGASASFSPTTVTGSGTTTMTVSTGLTTPGGSFPLSITGTSSSLNHSANVTLAVAIPIPVGVGFIKTDAATQGSWKGVYGADGFAITNDTTSYPGYAQVSFSNQLSATWAASTSDVRALQKGAPTATDRIASTWVSNTSFDIDIDLSDGNWHQVGFYCLDWDTNSRAQRIDILDAATSNVLDTRTVTGFSNGQYLLWNLRGHTRLRVTRTGGANAVISGIFFDAPASAPAINSFSPGSGAIGAMVTINGTNFTGATLVRFNTTDQAILTVVNATQITTTVPTGATSGAIQVVTPGGTATSATSFTVVPAAPTITDFTPTSGAIGAAVTISGTGFTNASKVTFNTIDQTVLTVVNDTQINTTVPASATSGVIHVTTPGGTATSTASFTVVAAPPAITGFSPASGAIGASVTVNGTGFTNASKVTFNTTDQTVLTVVNDTQVNTTVPASATSGVIHVTTPGGTATSTASFTVVAAPAITSFTPTNGAIGAAVTVNGTAFTNASKVTFNTTDQAVLTVVNDTQITTTVPAGATSGAIHVTTPGGTSTSAASFTVVAAPAITGFSPASGAIGAAVTVNGTGFTNASKVTFNTTDQAVLTVVNDTQITTAVPAGATSGAIHVTTPGGTATSATPFNVVSAPPTSLTANGENGQVSLNWTSVSGASSYKVKRSTTSGGPYTVIATPASTGYLDTGLINGVTYYYVVSAVNASGESANSTQVSATPLAPNQAPVIDAGPDQTINLPNTATLNGSVIDDGLPSNTLAITWTGVSGPGTVTFSNPNAVVTTANFSAAGVYVLRLTVSDGALSNSDDAIVTVKDLIFENGFESGNLAAWSSSATDGGSLSVSAGAGLVGNFGMQALINDNNSIYVTDESPTAESRYRARFYFHPNSISMKNGNAHNIFAGSDSSGSVVLQVEFRFSSGQYQLRVGLLNDGTGFSNTSWFAITNASHSIELDWRASTAPGANNGGVTLWIDGVQRANLTAIDNDTRRIERVRLGAVSAIDNGTRGTYYFDAFESRRITYIGPVVP